MEPETKNVDEVRLMCNKQQYSVMSGESAPPQYLRPLISVLYLHTIHSAVLLLTPSKVLLEDCCVRTKVELSIQIF